jgi:hypothetical protein
VNEFKYKCPNCTIGYCSLECFKKHRPQGEYICEKRISKAKVIIKDTVPPENLQKLHSKDIQKLLENKLLQDYLKAISASENPIEIMDQFRENELFLEFRELVLEKLK